MEKWSHFSYVITINKKMIEEYKETNKIKDKISGIHMDMILFQTNIF